MTKIEEIKNRWGEEICFTNTPIDNDIQFLLSEVERLEKELKYYQMAEEEAIKEFEEWWKEYIQLFQLKNAESDSRHFVALDSWIAAWRFYDKDRRD